MYARRFFTALVIICWKLSVAWQACLIFDDRRWLKMYLPFKIMLHLAIIWSNIELNNWSRYNFYCKTHAFVNKPTYCYYTPFDFFFFYKFDCLHNTTIYLSKLVSLEMIFVLLLGVMIYLFSKLKMCLSSS